MKSLELLRSGSSAHAVGSLKERGSNEEHWIHPMNYAMTSGLKGFRITSVTRVARVGYNCSCYFGLVLIIGSLRLLSELLG